jgi:hypothetical protein
MSFPIDWTTAPDDDSSNSFFPDVPGWSKVIKSSPGAIEDVSAGFTFIDGYTPIPWTDVTNAASNDGTNNASVTLTEVDPLYNCSDCLYAHDWGFAIPDGATIQALMVSINGTFVATQDFVNGGSGNFLPFALNVSGAWDYGPDAPLYPVGLDNIVLWYTPPGTYPPATNKEDFTEPSDIHPPIDGGIMAAFTDVSLTPELVNASGFGMGFSVLCGFVDGLPGMMATNIYAMAMAVYYTGGDSDNLNRCGQEYPNGNPLANQICMKLDPLSFSVRSTNRISIKLHHFLMRLRSKARILINLQMFRHSRTGLQVKRIPFLLMEKVPQNRQTYKLTAVNYATEYYDPHDDDFKNNFVVYNGGDESGGGGDGGTGDGNYRPSIYNDLGDLFTTNPEQAYDTLAETFADVSGTYSGGDGQKPDYVQYLGFPNLVLHADSTINIDLSFEIHIAGHVHIASTGYFDITWNSNHTRATISYTVPAGTNISTIGIGIWCAGDPHGSDNTWAICDIYDIWIVKV